MVLIKVRGVVDVADAVGLFPNGETRIVIGTKIKEIARQEETIQKAIYL